MTLGGLGFGLAEVLLGEMVCLVGHCGIYEGWWGIGWYEVGSMSGRWICWK